MFVRKIEDELSLALIQPSFAKDYFEIVSRQKEYLGQWLPWVTNADNEEFFLHFIKQSLHDYSDGKSLTCSIIYQNQVVGNISFNYIDYQLKKAEIGYWLSQDYQKLGIMHRAILDLLSIASDELNLQIIEIRIAEDNLPSRKVAERLNFKMIGILPNCEVINGQLINHALYVLDLKNK